MWLYAFVPVVVAVLGAVWVSFRPPGPSMVGAVQHLAAGVIFFAATAELLPALSHQPAVWPIVLGGAVGIAAMLLLRALADKAKGPAGLVATAALDSLVDGLALGLGIAGGARQGALLAIAIAIEFLFLSLAVAAAFGESTSRRTVIGATTGIALAVVPGVLLARPIGALPQAWQAVALAFGLIALLYLVTEELLAEAHKRPETPWSGAMFFVGFLALAVVDRMVDQ